MIPKPTIPEVLPFLKSYCAKPENSAGGSLHVVLDDGNFDDHHAQHCLEVAIEDGDIDGAVLAALLLRMSKTQRKKLARMRHD